MVKDRTPGFEGKFRFQRQTKEMHKTKRTGNLKYDGELALAHKAKSGDQLALQQLYELHTKPLYAFIAHHLDDPQEEVEDIWQETWMAAMHALQGFRGECSFFTWLCSIARHKIADHFRRIGRMENILTSEGFEDNTNLFDSDPIPEQTLADKALRLQVVETLMVLPVDYRVALMHRYVDELSVSEVARKMGKNYKITESLLTRARKAFQTEFLKGTAQEKKDE